MHSLATAPARPGDVGRNSDEPTDVAPQPPRLRVALGRDHRRRLPRRPRDWWVASSAGASGNPTVTLSTTGAKSLVAAAGNDWDTAAERTGPAGQQLLAQYLAVVGDTFWA